MISLIKLICILPYLFMNNPTIKGDILLPS